MKKNDEMQVIYEGGIYEEKNAEVNNVEEKY
jgi:hypothetical protein